MLTVQTMAKKRPKAGRSKGPPSQPQPEPLPPAVEHRDTILAIRCRTDFKAWVEDFAKSERMTQTILVELGLVELAKKKGFRMPPER
jgi:hypothetical protein